MKSLWLLPLLSLIPVAETTQCAGGSEIFCDYDMIMSGCNQLAHRFIRAAFHDAGTYIASTNTGGADGSLQHELGRDENASLRGPVDFAQVIAESFGVSVADALHLGAVRAIQKCGGIVIPFRFGRIDAPQANAPQLLPSVAATAQEIREKMITRMQLSVDEAVAIIGGGHSAAFGNQNGIPLDKTPGKIDNQYFIELVNIEQQVVAEQPGGGAKPIKLASDLNMMQDAEMKSAVMKFALDDQLFVQTFRLAYLKMSEIGAIFRDANQKPIRIGKGGAPSNQSNQANRVTAGWLLALLVLLGLLINH